MADNYKWTAVEPCIQRMKHQKSIPVKATKTSFEIVELLRDQNGATVTETASQLNIPKSTAYDHLKTLHDLEYLVKRDTTYRIGTQFLAVGDFERQNLELYKIAKPEVTKLADKTGDHANLMIEEHGHGVYLHKDEGKDAPQLDTHIGFRTHLHETALGKAILSQMEEWHVRKIVREHGLPERTKNTITELKELLDDLEVIRERGYAVDREERANGVRCIAAPIKQRGTASTAAISVSGVASKMQGARFEEDIPELVVCSANKIEVNLSFL